MISKFTKRRIRWIYGLVGMIVMVSWLFVFDQKQYFPDAQTDYLVSPNNYDDQLDEDDYISTVSIPGRFIDQPYFPVFIRYGPEDNSLMRMHCPEYSPLKDDGLNWRMTITTEGINFLIGKQDYSGEDFDLMMDCHSGIYELSVNDSVYSDLSYHFYVHPAKDQEGLLTVIPTDAFKNGENVLKVRKMKQDSSGLSFWNFARVPFWYNEP